jgi:hypothetical protein
VVLWGVHLGVCCFQVFFFSFLSSSRLFHHQVSCLLSLRSLPPRFPLLFLPFHLFSRFTSTQKKREDRAAEKKKDGADDFVSVP